MTPKRNYDDGRPITLPGDQWKAPEQKDSFKTFFTELKSFWFIVVAILGLVVTWTTFNGRLAQAEKDIIDMKVAIAELNTIKIQLQRIDTTVEFIKQRVK
jgi:hypothetical protein